MEYITTFDTTFRVMAIIQMISIMVLMGFCMFASKDQNRLDYLYSKVRALAIYANFAWMIAITIGMVKSFNGTTTFLFVMVCCAIVAAAIYYAIEAYRRKTFHPAA